MIIQCRQYLMSILSRMQIRGRIYTSMKELQSSNAVDYGAVLFNGESPKPSTLHRRFKTDKLSVRRFKVFDREINFMVSFGSSKAQHTESLYEDFMKKLDKAIIDKDENYVPIRLGAVEWLDSNDSILRSELLVQIEVIFEAGLYKDHEIIKIQEISQEHEIVKED